MTSSPVLDKPGLGAALAAFVLWGLFPLLFAAMAVLGAIPLEIVGWRIVFAAPFAAALVMASGGWDAAQRVFRAPRLLAVLALSAVLIAVNWSVYIWAVSSGRTLSASLGYYLNPLISLAAGALVFKERVSAAGWAGVALAAAGVALQAAALKALPVVPLTLAVSFAAYGVVRKRVPVDAAAGLLVECVILFVPAAVLVAVLEARGLGHFGHGSVLTLLLVLAGPATVLPLTAFAFAARRLPLSVVGVLQFISPTLQFCCGLLEGERLGPAALLSFAFIWSGVAVFLYGLGRRATDPTPSAAPAKA
jgi:chloramphenicol-sensitive protein RarD